MVSSITHATDSELAPSHFTSTLSSHACLNSPTNGILSDLDANKDHVGGSMVQKKLLPKDSLAQPRQPTKKQRALQMAINTLKHPVGRRVLPVLAIGGFHLVMNWASPWIATIDEWLEKKLGAQPASRPEQMVLVGENVGSMSYIEYLRRIKRHPHTREVLTCLKVFGSYQAGKKVNELLLEKLEAALEAEKKLQS